MEFILIFVAVIAVLVALVAVLTWSRRGQSSIDRESGDTLYETRSKEPEGGGTPPYLGGPDNWT